MRTILALFISGAAIVNVGCTDNGKSKAPTVQDSSTASAPPQVVKSTTSDASPLLQEIDKANSKCRDTPGDAADGIAACEKRDRLMQEAEKAGWCWGPQEAFGYEQHWIRCSDDPARRPKRQWFAHDLNHASCMKSPSPADKIREVQEFGQIAKTNDLPSGAVEVEVDIGNGRSQVWTFYHTPESCEASLPRSQKIDGKYE